jgi:two-component system, LuxR family, sensor kinase FixL
MLSLERLWDERHRTLVLAVSASWIVALAVVDRLTESYLSLGFLYLFPIMLAAAFLPRWAVVALGVTCSALAEWFSSLPPSLVRPMFEAVALASCGLFAGELIRNRRLSIESQAKLEALVETSPAAIVTIDASGSIELANRAAIDLLSPRNGYLVGQPIAAFLPELHHAIRWEEAPQFRTAVQCLGHRDNGESFSSNVWFSTYKEGLTPKLAAIIADATEEDVAGPPTALHTARTADGPNAAALSNRENAVLRLLVQGLANKEIAARLTVSESVVKNIMQQLFAKTGVRTRSQLVRVALEQYRNKL